MHRQDFNRFNSNSGRVSIVSFTSVARAPVRIESASFTLICSLTTGIIKKLLSITRNKEAKHNKILMLAKSKLSSIEIFVSQALIDIEISPKEFVMILKERDKYEKKKENFKNVMKNMRLNNVNSKKITSLYTVCLKYIFCIYKMYLVSADGYENLEVDMLTIKKLVKFG